MNKPPIMFLILALTALFLAGFLTWNLLNPKQVSGFYEASVGSFPNAPTDQVYAKTVIHFKNNEESDTND